MDLSLLLVALVVALACVVLTAIALAYARRRLVDVPGERSSHGEPTPTGGGIGLTVVMLIILLLLGLRQFLPMELVLATAAAVFVVAAAGWLDDHRQLAPGWRLLAQTLGAAAVVWALGGVPQLSLGVWSVSLGAVGSLLGVLGAVWLINLYNFMDGVDGLAAAEGIFVAGVMAALFWITGETGAALLAGALAGACSGFLFWNWSPARIFLGDVGSYSIGLLLAMLALYGERSGSLPLAVFLILAAVFLLDATFTLASRMMRGGRWYTAHREHAYQIPVASGLSHGQVVLGIGAINVLILLPAALAAWLRISWAPALLAGVVVSGLVSWVLVRRRYGSKKGNS